MTIQATPPQALGPRTARQRRDIDEAPRFEPFGPTTRTRQVRAAAVVMAGALPVGMVAESSYGRPPNLHIVLLAIGVIALVAWLVDGRRYVGAGSAATALGLAFVLMGKTSLDPYFLVFGLLGAALLLVSKANSRAIGGSAGLLLYVAINAAGLHRADATLLPRAWIFALIMLVWGGTALRRTLSDSSPAAATVAPGDGTA